LSECQPKNLPLKFAGNTAIRIGLAESAEKLTRRAPYLLRESISIAADKFKAYGFIRIHRSVLVNSLFVEKIRPRSTGEYEPRMRGGNQYTVTRTYKDNLKSLAKMWIGSGTLLAD